MSLVDTRLVPVAVPPELPVSLPREASSAPPPLLAGWSPPDDLPDLGRGEYALPAGWALRVLPAGLVLRDRRRPQELVVGPPTEPGWVDVRVDAPASGVPHTVLVVMARMCRALSRDVPGGVRLIVPDGEVAGLADLGAALQIPVLRMGDGPLSPPWAPGSGSSRSRVSRRGRGLITARLDLVVTGATDPTTVPAPPRRGWRSLDPADPSWRPGIRRRRAP